MKNVIALFAALLIIQAGFAQFMIHSHNDYVHTRPFYEAYQADAYSIEADVYLRDNNLMVAHAANEIKPGVTIEKLYLEPLTKVCVASKQNGKKSLPVILVDFKDEYGKVMPVLLAKLANMKKQILAQGVDTMPTFVISGNRPPADSFHYYPAYIQFDGRPYEQYDKTAMEKVAFISDQYLKYTSWNGKDAVSPADSATLLKLIQSVHDKGKLLRLWNTPDTELAWKSLHAIGVDIINTDQPAECRKYLTSIKPNR